MAHGQLIARDDESREIADPGLIEQQGGRWMQEVQAMIVMASRNPRNEQACLQRMLEACKRKSFAETALYSYPRGKENVTGPSIRMAEMMAQRWRNLEFGQVELEQTSVDSLVLAYAWDLESNVRQARMFRVPHQRKAGQRIVRLDDPRDVYEHVANMGARRMRAAILSVIPRDIQDAVVEQVYETKAGKAGESIEELVRKSLKAFKDAFGVTSDAIQERFNDRPFSEFTHKDIVELRSIYQSLKEGQTTLATWWPDRFGESASKPSKAKVVKPTKKNEGGPGLTGDADSPLSDVPGESATGPPSLSPDEKREAILELLTEADMKMRACKTPERIADVLVELLDRAEALDVVEDLDAIAEDCREGLVSK